MLRQTIKLLSLYIDHSQNVSHPTVEEAAMHVPSSQYWPYFAKILSQTASNMEQPN